MGGLSQNADPTDAWKGGLSQNADILTLRREGAGELKHRANIAAT